MRLQHIVSLLLPPAGVVAFEDPLSYRHVQPVYTPPTPENTTTLLDFISSREDLSKLKRTIKQIGGFAEAFATNPTWKFTFFAPNNDAFNQTGRYFSTFKETPKGKMWLGNTLVHHYVPNSLLESTKFNESYQQFQTATYLFVGAQVEEREIMLNKVARLVEKDIPVSQGVVHIVDHILDPSAQIYEEDLPWLPQTFIAGSCSNPALPYC